MCTAFLALSLIEEGYTVYANADASGALSERISSDANDRMRAAGVHVLSSFAVVLDLMRDWRNTPGSLELLPYFDKWATTLWYYAPLTFFTPGISPLMGSSLVAMLLPLAVVPFFPVNLSNNPKLKRVARQYYVIQIFWKCYKPSLIDEMNKLNFCPCNKIEFPEVEHCLWVLTLCSRISKYVGKACKVRQVECWVITLWDQKGCKKQLKFHHEMM